MDLDSQLLTEMYRRIHENTEPGKKKLHRDTFIYLPPKEPKQKFAQCETCQMWTSSSRNRCSILGEKVEVKADDSCGLYVHGKPDPEQETSPTVTAEEVGLTHHQVRCENCAVFDAAAGICKGFQTLNEKLPDLFDLEIKVDAHGCCNAWHSND